MPGWLARQRRGRPWSEPGAPSGGFVFAVPRQDQLAFFGDADQAKLFADSIRGLERIDGRPVEIDFQPLRDVAGLLYEGPFLAERLAGLEPFFSTHRDDIHPVTRTIVEGGARYSAVDVFKATAALAQLRRRCERYFADADLLVVPTMPTIPLLSEVQANSLEWGRRLGSYTNFVNLLGWAALAVPSGFTPSKLPGGITLIGPGSSEALLCRIGQAWQEHLPPRRRWVLPARPCRKRGTRR